MISGQGDLMQGDIMQGAEMQGRMLARPWHASQQAASVPHAKCRIKKIVTEELSSIIEISCIITGIPAEVQPGQGRHQRWADPEAANKRQRIVVFETLSRSRRKASSPACETWLPARHPAAMLGILLESPKQCSTKKPISRFVFIASSPTLAHTATWQGHSKILGTGPSAVLMLGSFRSVRNSSRVRGECARFSRGAQGSAGALGRVAARGSLGCQRPGPVPLGLRSPRGGEPREGVPYIPPCELGGLQWPTGERWRLRSALQICEVTEVRRLDWTARSYSFALTACVRYALMDHMPVMWVHACMHARTGACC